jgi:hypothetical protein
VPQVAQPDAELLMHALTGYATDRPDATGSTDLGCAYTGVEAHLHLHLHKPKVQVQVQVLAGQQALYATG